MLFDLVAYMLVFGFDICCCIMELVKTLMVGLKARSLTVNRCKTNFIHTTGGPYIERGRVDASDVTGQSGDIKSKEGRRRLTTKLKLQIIQ